MSQRNVRSSSVGPADSAGPEAAGAKKPSAAQLKWLARGLTQAGGKLPLFDDEGRTIPPATIRACMAAGWAEPWFSNPIKPDWLVCRLTEAGRKAVLAASGK